MLELLRVCVVTICSLYLYQATVILLLYFQSKRFRYLQYATLFGLAACLTATSLILFGPSSPKANLFGGYLNSILIPLTTGVYCMSIQTFLGFHSRLCAWLRSILFVQAGFSSLALLIFMTTGRNYGFQAIPNDVLTGNELARQFQTTFTQTPPVLAYYMLAYSCNLLMSLIFFAHLRKTQQKEYMLRFGLVLNIILPLYEIYSLKFFPAVFFPVALFIYIFEAHRLSISAQLEIATERLKFKRSSEMGEKLLEQSLKASGIQTDVASVAHEVNNHLAVVLGYCRLAQNQIKSHFFERHKVLDSLVAIEKASSKIGKAVENIRAHYRPCAGKEESSLQLEKVLVDSLSFLKLDLDQHKIRVGVTGPLNIRLHLDSSLFSQILLNLLRNSIQAIRNLEERWIEIEAEPTRQSFRLFITDSGKGIADEISDNILKPFFTTKDGAEGSGLGLYISKVILEAHGGSLSLDQNSKHTRFVIELERYEQLIEKKRTKSLLSRDTA